MSIHKTHADSLGMQEYDVYTSMIRPGSDITKRLAQGGLIMLGPGNYYVSEAITIQYPTQIMLRGAGRQQTIINTEAPITISTDDVEDYELVKYSRFEGVTFLGPVTRTFACFEISWASRFSFIDFEIRRYTQAIDAMRMWDFEFLNGQFVNCGTSVLPAVDIQLLENASMLEHLTASNNNAFTNCLWEPTLGIGLRFGAGSTGNRVLGCKWHGDTPALPYDHIVFEPDSYANVIMGNALVNCGNRAIVLDDSDGNMIIGNRISNCDVAGIAFENGSVDNVIIGNSFGIGPGSNNVEDITGTTTDNEIANNPGYVP